MSVKLLTEHNLEWLSLKEAAQARLSLHLSICHIVGNHMRRLNYSYAQKTIATCCDVDDYIWYISHTISLTR